MLERLEGLAQSLNIAFAFGDITDLDAFVRDRFGMTGLDYILFHEGFFLANLNQDGQGALEYRFQLTLDVLVKSKPTDKPDDKHGRLLGLEIELRRVYKALTKLGQVSNARAVFGKNLTTSNLDAIQLTLTLLPDAESLCNL